MHSFHSYVNAFHKLRQQRTGWMDPENGRFLPTFSTVFADVGGWVKFPILTSLHIVNLDTLTFFPEYEVA